LVVVGLDAADEAQAGAGEQGAGAVGPVAAVVAPPELGKVALVVERHHATARLLRRR
jgi:hypothetical protein